MGLLENAYNNRIAAVTSKKKKMKAWRQDKIQNNEMDPEIDSDHLTGMFSLINPSEVKV